MVKNLKIFESITDKFKPPVQIYTGPIHQMYVDGFELTSTYKTLCTKKDIIVKEGAFFYKNENGYGCFEYNPIFEGKKKSEEACNNVIFARQESLLPILAKRISNPTEGVRILNSIKQDSVSLYFEPNELKYSHTVSYKEFKELLAKAQGTDKNKSTSKEKPKEKTTNKSKTKKK